MRLVALPLTLAAATLLTITVVDTATVLVVPAVTVDPPSAQIVTEPDDPAPVVFPAETDVAVPPVSGALADAANPAQPVEGC